MNKQSNIGIKTLVALAAISFMLSNAACTANTAQGASNSATVISSSNATQSTSATTWQVVPMAMSRSSR